MCLYAYKYMPCLLLLACIYIDVYMHGTHSECASNAHRSCPKTETSEHTLPGVRLGLEQHNQVEKPSRGALSGAVTEDAAAGGASLGFYYGSLKVQVFGLRAQ